jgi:hypothetical protein
VKRTISLAGLIGFGLFVLLAGCGNPASGTLQSITMTTASGSFQLQGAGGTIQLVATGNYSSMATKNLTGVVTYTATPIGHDEQGAALPATSSSDPQTISVSPTGLVTAIPPFVCTYYNSGTVTTPAWVLTGSYQIVATYDKVASQPVYVGVAAAAGTGPNDGGQCGPAPTTGG